MCWLSLVTFVLFYFGISFASMLYFITCYIWSYSLAVPNLKRYLITRKYKFSFLKIAYQIDCLIKRTGKWYIAAKHLPPLILMILLYLIGRQGNLLFALLGILTYEAFLKLREFLTSEKN